MRPVNPPPNDRRGRRLLRAGFALVATGCTVSVVIFPWLAGEPTAGQVEPVPRWASVASDLALVALSLGIVCFIARWIVRRRSAPGSSVSVHPG
jgi:hypothetical protein